MNKNSTPCFQDIMYLFNSLFSGDQKGLRGLVSLESSTHIVKESLIREIAPFSKAKC